MAKYYIEDPYALFNGHDVSAYVKSVEVDRKKDELDTTASGDGAHTMIPGLAKDTFTLNLYQDKDFSVLDVLFADVYDAETPVVFECCNNGSTVSESNPSFSGNVYVLEHKPLTGDVGTVSMLSVVLTVTGGITRSGT